MSVPLDPYHRFLGIPPHLQPANHYRLLGLELFEGNSTVIEDAADRQIAHVRKYELGPYAADARKLLDELSNARVCLLLPERKTAYDAALRKHLASAATATAVPMQGSATALPANIEDEELILQTDPLPRDHSMPAKPKPSGGIVPNSPVPPAVASGKSTPVTAPRAVVAPPTTLYSPIDPVSREPVAYEPPYMREYRRRFFETLLKVAIFVFILVILLLLFNSMVLPWLTSGHSVPALAAEKEMPPPPAMAVETNPVAVSAPIESKPDSPAEDDVYTGIEMPDANLSEIDPAPKPVSIFKTIRTAFQNNEIRRSPFIGEVSGDVFEDQYRDGGLLVALKMTWKKFGKNGDGRAVASVQPEYLTSLGYVKGKVLGSPEKNGVRFLAKAGYAIGGLKVNYAPGSQGANGRIVGVRVVFMRREGERLNPLDSYLGSSFPLDSSVPLNAPEIGGNGELAVGIFGSSTKDDLSSLGLFLLKANAFSPPGADANQVPPESGETDVEMPSPEGENFFIGSWFIYEEGRFASTVVLNEDHTARDRRYHRAGGKWSYENEQVRIIWKDGWKDVFERDGDKFRKYSFAPSDPNEHIPTNEGTAVKSTDAVGG